MPTSHTFALSDDLPKRNPWQDDRLGFRPFSERLYKVISSLNVPNGYVIGLHGEWGSGKSTALNFVKAFIDKHNQENGTNDRSIRVIDFQPWIISGHQDLIAAFFKVVSETISSTKPSWARRQVMRALRFLGGSSDPLLDAIARLALIWDPTAGLASGAVTTVAKKSVDGLIDRFITDPSLQDAYGNLRKVLRENRSLFLVIIDDLDRLQPEEIRAIMQMVKTVGRLPNVVYLLAYERRIVWDALDREIRGGSPRFAEKIVQQEIDLPQPLADSLLLALDEEMDFLPSADSDTLRWHYLVQDGIRRWIRRPRDVLRLANAVKFSWPALENEIDPQDLVVLEGLRLFDVVAFTWVRENRDFLLATRRFAIDQKAIREAVVGHLKEKLPAETRDQVLSILAILFPSHAKSFEGKYAYVEESYADVIRRRGVGCDAGYDAYFSLRPSPDAIPKHVVDGLMDKLDDEEACFEILSSFIPTSDRLGAPMIGHLLQELMYRFKVRNPPAPTRDLLNALFRVGEPILKIPQKHERFSRWPGDTLSLLVAELLRLWGPEEADKCLASAFGRAGSATFCAFVFIDRGRELGVFPSHGHGVPLITSRLLKNPVARRSRW